MVFQSPGAHSHVSGMGVQKKKKKLTLGPVLSLSQSITFITHTLKMEAEHLNRGLARRFIRVF